MRVSIFILIGQEIPESITEQIDRQKVYGTLYTQSHILAAYHKYLCQAVF